MAKPTWLCKIYFLLIVLFVVNRSQLLAGVIPQYQANNSISSKGFEHIGLFSDLAEDKNSEWKFIDVKLDKYNEFFSPTGTKIKNIQFTTSTYWMRSEFYNSTHESNFFIECARPITNEVELYLLNAQGELVQMQTSGDAFPFEARPIKHRRNVFRVNIPAGERATFILRMRSDGEVINAQMKLWTIEAFSEFSQFEDQTLGVYYGLLVSVLIIFSFIAIVMKQKVYTYYVLYIASLVFMQSSLDAIAFQNFWPNNTWLANHSVLIFSASSVFLLMIYAGVFLGIKTFPKAFFYTYRFFQGLVLVCFFTAMTYGITYELTFPFVNGISLVALLLIIGAMVYKAMKGFEVNLPFALGFISVLNGGILFIAGNFGLYFNEFLVDNAIKIGSTGEVIFLSMAMAGRYRQIQLEKEQAQEEAYNHLEAINKITENQKERLEKIVIRRTSEIKKANEQLAEKNKEIIDSINYAQRIQQAILPPHELINKHLPKSFIAYLPKDIVAGDFYWMETTVNPEISDETVILFAAADCTGHGVPGALVSVVCSNALNRAVREYNLVKPNEILDRISILVEETFSKSELKVKDGMDISLCAFYTKSNILEWSGANNGLYIVSNSEKRKTENDSVAPFLIELKPNKQPIGVFDNRTPFDLQRIQLESGERIYSFTDGYVDQFGGEKGKKYKSKNFKEFLRSIYSQPIKEQKNSLITEFNNWRGEIDQIDDVCVFGVEV